MTLEEARKYAQDIATGRFIDPELFSKARGEAMVVLDNEIERLRKGIQYIADYETDYPQTYADKLLEGP